MTQSVFIIGAARSGTKYLRDLLAISRDACCVPYDINYVWRHGDPGAPDDALRPDALTPSGAAFIRHQVSRLANSSGNEHAVMLEKTVSNALRPEYVHAVFPEAKFIHLIRDGRAVTESALRQWELPPQFGRIFRKLRDMPLRNAGYALWYAANAVKGFMAGRHGGKVWGPRYPGLDADMAQGLSPVRLCARQWRICVESARRDLAKRPRDSVFTVRYRDLVSGEGVVRDLVEFCGLVDGDRIVDHHRSTVLRDEDDKWRERLTLPQQDEMMSEIADTLRQLDLIDEGERL